MVSGVIGALEVGSRLAVGLAIELLELAREALPERIVAGRRRARDRRRVRRAHPAADDERHDERAGEDDREGRDPREPVEAAEGRRRQHLLPVALAEGLKDRLLALAA